MIFLRFNLPNSVQFEQNRQIGTIRVLLFKARLFTTHISSCASMWTCSQQNIGHLGGAVARVFLNMSLAMCPLKLSLPPPYLLD